MADVALTKAELAKTRRLGKFVKAWDPKQQGAKEANPRTVTEDSLIKLLDVPISVRDGTILRGNIVRSASQAHEKLPVFFNYSLYGKDGGIDIAAFPPAASLDSSRITNEYLFEAADAGWWCPKGYVVPASMLEGRTSPTATRAITPGMSA